MPPPMPQGGPGTPPGGPMGSAPQQPPQPPPRPPQPGNEGLINRVLNLIKKDEPDDVPKGNISAQLQAMADMGLDRSQGQGNPGQTPQGGSQGMPQGGGGLGHAMQLLQMLALRHRLGASASGPLMGGMGGGGGGSPMGMASGGYSGMPMLGYARGGPDFVQDQGHGDGRSDHVEARLSPGEFVMDAETTSLLGNGDSAAGARKLEELRQKIRKHKGRALARGKFSPDADDAGDYLPKGALS